MTHLKHIADSVPGPLYTHHRFDDLIFSRSIFQDGQWQTMEFPGGVAFKDLASSHIQTRGVFCDDSDVLPDRHPGWISRQEDFIVQAGQYKRIAHGVVEVWCCRNTNGEHAVVDSMSIAQGAAVALQPGERMLIVSGKAECNGKTLPAPRAIDCVTDGVMVTAVEDCLAFRWVKKIAD